MAWSSIRGHGRVIREFRAVWRAGRLGQAYLFVGTAGIGKRTFATELAKAILCSEKADGLEACDRCPSCRLAHAGTHPDILSAAQTAEKSELTLDVVRTLCDQLSLKASLGSRKVAVVDDAAEMNEEAGNAFLKTLEEPPAGSLLILVGGPTADRHLRTIRSRCQIVEFADLSEADLRAVLAAAEVPHPVDDLSIALAAGSVGRAIHFAEPKFAELRGRLFADLAKGSADPFAWAETWMSSLDDLGKGLPAQREMSRRLLYCLIEITRRAWQIALGSPDSNPATASMSQPLADRYGVDRLADWLTRFQQTDDQIGRMVKLDYAVEAMALDAMAGS